MTSAVTGTGLTFENVNAEVKALEASKGFKREYCVGAYKEYEIDKKLYQVTPDESAVEYMTKMKELCKAHDAELVMVKMPTIGMPQIYYASWSYDKYQMAKAICDEIEVPFLDMVYDEAYRVEIDWKKDVIDGGQHFNIRGAEKITECIAAYCEQIGLEKQINEYYWQCAEEYDKVKRICMLQSEFDFGEYIERLLENDDYTDDRRKEEEKTTTYSFILDSAGNLRCTESFETIRIIGQGTQWWRGKKGDVGFRDFDEYMREFDFHANGRYSNSSFLEYTHLARDYEGYACRSDSDMAILERNYEKGYGLYYALKSILEEGKLPQNPDKPVPVADKPKESAGKKSGSGGCYVATAVYGSYDCPEVWTLRRYRDDKLARTFWGRSLIRIYYTVSPTVVRLVGNTGWFHRIWRRRLDKMVRALRERGFDSTPYEDRPW